MLADNYQLAVQVGFFIGTKEETYVRLDVSCSQFPEVSKWLWVSNRDLTVLYGKRNMFAAHRLCCHLPVMSFDVCCASYQFNPEVNSKVLGKMSEDQVYQVCPREVDVYGKGAKRQVPVDKLLL